VTSFSLGLPGAARRAVDLTRGKAGIRGRELNIDRAEFGGLTRTSQRRLTAKVLKLLLRRAAKRRLDSSGCQLLTN
jgi:hypothetical protein